MRRQARVNERPGASQDQAYQWASPDVIGRSLTDAGYLADERICSVVYLGDRLGKPVLVEGPAGTGKTELAKSVAAAAGRRLIRLQCYEGLDEAKALYEWNYSKQLLRIQAERTGTDRETADWTDLQADIFSQEFLLTRPLLAAIRAPDPVVLLIDEVDRIDVETEALLLEVLSDYQISIPELGTVTSTQTPLVFLTSNNSRELSEALKRRCLYLYLDYPAPEREQAIVLRRVPDLSVALADQITRVVGSLRRLELKKRPSVSETIDWARTLSLLGVEEISTELIIDTLHVLLKHQPDIEKAALEFSRTR
jgi:MoxR-like ATPase